MFDKELQEKIDLVKDILITKNKCYGNSALEPIRIFSRADTIEQLKVRLDDKLSRLAKGKDVLEKDKDVIVDLIGYLFILLIALDKKEKNDEA